VALLAVVDIVSGGGASLCLFVGLFVDITI